MRGNLFNIGVISQVQGGSASQGILDKVSGADYAGSLRLLRAAYAGPVVELEIQGGGSTDDFFDAGGGVLNNASGDTPTEWLTSLGLPTNTGLRVRKLYNQATGGGQDIQQTAIGLQPHIYQGGGADYYRIGTNNRITLHWDPSDDALDHPTGWPGSPDASICVVQELLETEPAHLLLQGVSSSYYAVVSSTGNATPNVAGNVHINAAATGSTTRGDLYTDIQGVYNTTPVPAHTAQYTDVVMSGPGWDTWRLNKYSTNSYFSNQAKIAEIIIYPTILGAADVTTIADDQKAYYGL